MKPILLLSLFGLAVTASCSREEQRALAAPEKPAVVSIANARTENWPATYEASGTVHARTAATISSKVSGYVERVAVDQGSRVAQGQTLITLDARDLEAGLRRAQAGVSEVTSAIPEADSAAAAAKASLDLAEATSKRMEELAAKKSISNQEMDEATAKVKAARANYEMVRARRTQLTSRLAQANEEQRAAQVMRDYARIVAPFAGVVTAKTVEPGNLAMPGAPLLTIESAGGYRLEASVEESKIASVRAGDRVRVSLEAADCEGAGRVSEIVPTVDAATRSYIVKIDLPPANDAGKTQTCRDLRSGMFGRALFPLGKRNVIAIPAAALVERGQLRSVFVSEDGWARTRLVTIGQRSGETVEVLSGLNDGERVVAPVPASLVDGSRLEVRQ